MLRAVLMFCLSVPFELEGVSAKVSVLKLPVLMVPVQGSATAAFLILVPAPVMPFLAVLFSLLELRVWHLLVGTLAVDSQLNSSLTVPTSLGTEATFMELL